MRDLPLLLHVDASWCCPWACSCFVALREKGLSFATSVALISEERITHATYRARSLTARVPALQHGDFWIAESSAIVEYVEEMFPSPAYPRLLPEELHERARARQIMAWLRSDLWHLREEWDSTTIFYRYPAPPRLSDAGEREVQKVLEVAERLISPSRPEQLFSDWSIADADLAFVLRRLAVNGRALSPHLLAFTDAQWDRPSMREFAEHPRPPHPMS